MNLLPRITPRDDSQQREADLERTLIRQEAQIGGQLFGAVPAGHRREFFCLDEHTWVWHEEWTTTKGERQIVTTHYHIRPNGMLKSRGNGLYQRLSKDEARNLYRATELYRQRVGRFYQQMLATA